MIPVFIEDRNHTIFFAFNKIGIEYLCVPKIVGSYKGKNYSEWYINDNIIIEKYYKYFRGLGEKAFLVNENELIKIYDPRQFVEHGEYLKLEKTLGSYVEKIISKISRYFDISESDIGIEGSILLGNCNQNSDIDILVYGKENSKKIQENFCKYITQNIKKYLMSIQV